MNFKFTALVLVLGSIISVQTFAKTTSRDSVPVVDGPFGGTLVKSMISDITTPTFSGELRSAVYVNGERGTDIYYQLANNFDSKRSLEVITQGGKGSIDMYYSDSSFIGGWIAQTNSDFGMFTVGTAKAGMTWSVIEGHCMETCQTLGADFYTYTLFVDSSVGPGTKVLTGIAPGTASYTGAVYAGTIEHPSYALGQVNIDGQMVNAFVSTVPEPETYALMLAGLGMIGAMVRRRKAQAA